MSRSRILTAMLAMIAIALASGLLLPDLGRSVAWSVGQSALVFFLAATAGAWFARERFVAHALCVWAGVWAVVAALLHFSASPVAQSSIGAILQHNWLAILLSGGATVAGALSGHVLAAGTRGALGARHPG